MNDTDVAHNNDEEENLLQPLCPSVVERYFTRGYEVNLPKGFTTCKDDPTSTNFNDVCILRHSNKLCIVTLAPSHPIIKKKDSVHVTDINFKVTEKLDRSQNQVSGKRKRGAHWLNTESALCIVTCSDDTKYTIHSGIRGNLVEINEKLLTKPCLLQKKYETEGFIAIVMPKIAEANLILDGLLDEAAYKSYLKLSEGGYGVNAS